MEISAGNIIISNPENREIDQTLKSVVSIIFRCFNDLFRIEHLIFGVKISAFQLIT